MLQFIEETLIYNFYNIGYFNAIMEQIHKTSEYKYQLMFHNDSDSKIKFILTYGKNNEKVMSAFVIDKHLIFGNRGSYIPFDSYLRFIKVDINRIKYELEKIIFELL